MPELSTGEKQRIEVFMGPWRHQQAISNLEARLMRQETLYDDLQRQQRKLDLEFSELYDKVSRLMSRMARRYAHDKKETNGEPPLDTETPPSDGLDPISRDILQRRARLGKQL